MMQFEAVKPEEQNSDLTSESELRPPCVMSQLRTPIIESKGLKDRSNLSRTILSVISECDLNQTLHALVQAHQVSLVLNVLLRGQVTLRNTICLFYFTYNYTIRKRLFIDDNLFA